MTHEEKLEALREELAKQDRAMEGVRAAALEVPETVGTIDDAVLGELDELCAAPAPPPATSPFPGIRA